MNPFKLRIRVSPRKGKTDRKKERQDMRRHAAKIYSRLYRLEMAMADELKSKKNLTDEEREQLEKMRERKTNYNKGCARRMQKLRAKRKEAEAALNNSKGERNKPKTRQRVEEERAYWRKKKKDQRALLTQRQKVEINKRRRDKYAMEKAKKKTAKLAVEQAKLVTEACRLKELEQALKQQAEEIHQAKSALNSIGLDVRTPAARRKSLQRARRGMPQRPSHYVTTALDLMEKASPRKMEAFKNAKSPATVVEDAVMEAVSAGLSKSRFSKARKILATTLSSVKRYKLQRSTAKKIGVSRKLISKAIKHQAGRKKLQRSIVKVVEDFYETVANQLPDKKLVSKKSGKPTSIMDCSVTKAYHQFKLLNPQIKISLSKFFLLRPLHIKTQKEANYRGCLCEYCENITLKLKVINAHLAAVKVPPIKDIYHFASITMCDKLDADFHHPQCVLRKCTNCGISQLDRHIEPLLHTETQNVEWKRWELITQKVQKGVDKLVDVRTRTLIVKSGNMSELITELKEEGIPFAEHLFNKGWQNKQLQLIRSNLPQDSCLCILDFAENYRCAYQDEVQGAYWTQDSATVHPIVTYYRCAGCSDVITESLVFIRDDLVHDFHAVNAFQNVACNHLTNSRHLTLSKLYRFSDGCGQQYKSKGPLSDISYATSDFGYPIVHNFTGSRHGKGASDGESAVIKSHASTAVKTGRCVIKSAKDLYKYCCDHLTKDASSDMCTHFRRTIFYVPSSDINRDRNHRLVKTVPGTMKLHSVKTVSDGIIATRNLSCFCTPCLDNNDSLCENSLYVKMWKKVSLYSGHGIPATSSTSPEGNLPNVAQPCHPECILYTFVFILGIISDLKCVCGGGGG